MPACAVHDRLVRTIWTGRQIGPWLLFSDELGDWLCSILHASCLAFAVAVVVVQIENFGHDLGLPECHRRGERIGHSDH